MIKAKHNRILYPFFKLYTQWQVKQHFTVVRIGELETFDASVLLISNHISWWDGFWAAEFNMRVTKKRFYFMMEEKQLLEHRFFSLIGGFSIKKRVKDAVQSLDYASELLSNRENLVLVFPQGKIESLYNQDIVFESGVERLINKSSKDIQIIFLVNLVDYHSKKRPTLYQYYSSYNKDESIYYAYNKFFNECVSIQKAIKS